MNSKALQKKSPTIALTEVEAAELGKCYRSPSYFINTYCHIYDAASGGWVPFKLWKSQEESLSIIHGNQLTVILKARQIGMTWMTLAYALWSMIFRPIASVLIFSRRDTDAIYLLSEDRLRGIYARLPIWMKSGLDATTDNAHEWGLANDSTARSFPTTAGDSYTATLAIVDEADLAPDLNSLLRSVKPTIDNGGKMVLLSRADKTKPISDFKRIYRDAAAGKNGWASIFLPWWVHPARNIEWYEAQKIDIQSRTGSLDDLYEQYPANENEALRPRSMDKRIPYGWLENAFVEKEGNDQMGIPGLTVYVSSVPYRQYVIGADSAEGNPNSDDSAATVLDLETGEEVAVLVGKFQPSTFADYVCKLSHWYNEAGVMVERNNHGHAVLLKMEEDAFPNVLKGHDGRPGWHSTTKGKALMYTSITDAVRDGEIIIHSPSTLQQLASIEGSTLRAPKGQYDDLADSIALAQVGIEALTGGVSEMKQGSVKGRSTTSRRQTVKVVRTAKRISRENTLYP